MVRRIIILGGIQVGWFSCVQGASNGRPVLGPVVVLLVVGLYGFWVTAGWPFLRSAVRVIAIGVVADGLLAMTGVISFSPIANVGWPSPLWMVALWLNIVPALDDLGSFLGPGIMVPAIAGAICGPLAYFAGSALGALTLASPIPGALGIIGLEWAVAMPLLLKVRPCEEIRV